MWQMIHWLECFCFFFGVCFFFHCDRLMLLLLFMFIVDVVGECVVAVAVQSVMLAMLADERARSSSSPTKQKPRRKIRESLFVVLFDASSSIPMPFLLLLCTLFFFLLHLDHYCYCCLLTTATHTTVRSAAAATAPAAATEEEEEEETASMNAERMPHYTLQRTVHTSICCCCRSVCCFFLSIFSVNAFALLPKEQVFRFSIAICWMAGARFFLLFIVPPFLADLRCVCIGLTLSNRNHLSQPLMCRVRFFLFFFCFSSTSSSSSVFTRCIIKFSGLSETPNVSRSNINTIDFVQFISSHPAFIQ